MEIDRRKVLLGAGVGALALAGCCDDVDSETPRGFRGVEPDWNFGDDPWRTYDQEVADEPRPPAAAFNPDHIAVLHLEISASPFELKARRAHFPTDSAMSNDLTGITPRVAEVIQYLNGLTAIPGYLRPIDDKKGAYQFGFSRAHHFVIYIKNKGVSYDPNYPIWFGGMLIAPRGTDYRADPNRSFFGAKRSSSNLISPTGNESDQFVYAMNYFYTADETADERIPINRRKINNEKMKYSLNINASINSSDANPINIPLVIDPDTGNMGGGGGGSGP